MRIKQGQQKLTKAQLELAKRFAQDQIERYLSTSQFVSDATVEHYVQKAYEVANLKPPQVKWFVSPEEFCKHGYSVWDSVGDSVWDSVWDSVRDSVWDSVWYSVWDSVGDSVWDSVWDSVMDSVWDSVGASVRASVRDSVGASVGASVRGSVWDSVGSWDDSSWMSFYKFFHKNFRRNDLVWLQYLSENVTGYSFFANECWLVRKPIVLSRDDQGRLHSQDGMAIAWRDGFGFYFIHGVRFDQELWEKVIQRKISPKKVLSLPNIEQRMAVFKLYGPQWLVENTKAEFIEKSPKGNELYLIKGVFSQDAYFLKYQDPSTNRVYVSGVDPKVGKEGSADACMAWKHHLTLKEYLGIKAES